MKNIFVAALFITSLSAGAQTPPAGKVFKSAPAAPAGKAISPDLFGIFFEDLNYAADGGLYAELIQNRSFEYSSADDSDWTFVTGCELIQRGGNCSIALGTEPPVHPNNPHYLVMNVEAS